MKFSYNTFDFTTDGTDYFSEKLKNLHFTEGIHTLGIYDHQLKIPGRMDELLHELNKTHINIQILNTNTQIQDDYYALVLITFKTNGHKL